MSNAQNKAFPYFPPKNQRTNKNVDAHLYMRLIELLELRKHIFDSTTSQ